MRYHLLGPYGTYHSSIPGRFAGWRQGRLFGRLDCASGTRKLKPENRVFFATWDDAVRCGYAPCKLCKPDRPEGGLPAPERVCGGRVGGQ